MPAEAMVLYGSANRPLTDAAISGGAIDTQWRPLWYELSWRSLVQILSNNPSDTRTVTITGRDSTGNPASETLTLQGTNAVSGFIEWFRIDQVEAAATSATATILIIQQLGSLIIHEINPGELGAFRMFRNASASGSTISRYEKLFWKNTAAADVPTLATVTLTHDAIGKIQIALETGVNGTQSVADRTIAPGGVTFYNDNDPAPVPGGTLAAGDAIGVWIEMTLHANDGPYDAFLGLQFCGDFPENNLLGCPEIPENPCLFNCGPPTNPPPVDTTVPTLAIMECGHTCPLTQYAEVTYNGATAPGGPFIRGLAFSLIEAFYCLAAVYVPAQSVIVLTLYNGEALTGLGTIYATHAVTLAVNDVLRIESDATTPTIYRVKVNGTIVISITIGEESLSVVAPCIGFVPVSAVPGGLAPTGDIAVVVTKTSDTSKTTDTVLASDSELTFTIAAGETWGGYFTLLIVAGSSTPDFKYTIVGPAGCSGQFTDINWNYESLAFGASTTVSSSIAGTVVHVDFVVTNGGTAGAVSLQWAQSTSSADFTKLLAKSSIVTVKQS